MRAKSRRFLLLFVTLALAAAGRPAEAQLWKHLIPASHVEPATVGDYRLAEEHGPWLIVAASFQGDGAETLARQLADELRQRHRLAAYVHDRTFDFAEQRPGRGLDDYGAPIRRRYQRESTHDFAVLVGDFPSTDDPEAQATLERIKTLPSRVLSEEGNAPRMDQVRQLSNVLFQKSGSAQNRGPMGKAFLTRNPLLPREYFVPKGVDEFVAKMNDGVEFSLLDCPGRYTVQVATFRGKTVLQTSATESAKSESGWSWRKTKNRNNPLVEAAEDAHVLAQKLRDHGWEAYEFHDRTESIVTIGSFDQAAQQLADGRVVPTPQVQRIIQTFGAAYDTPADPLSKKGNDAATQRQLADVERQFTQALSSRDIQVAAGLRPKHVKIMRGNNVDRVIPMDIYPHAIEAPKRSLSGVYAR